MVKKYSNEKIKCEACNITVSKPDYTEHLASREHMQLAVFIENT